MTRIDRKNTITEREGAANKSDGEVDQQDGGLLARAETHIHRAELLQDLKAATTIGGAIQMQTHMLDEVKSEIDHSHQTMVSKARALLLSEQEQDQTEEEGKTGQPIAKDAEEAEEFKREIEAVQLE